MRHAPPLRRVLLGAAAVLAALVLLDAGMTLHNVDPGFAVHWPGEFSFDLAVIVLLLVLHGAWRGRLGPSGRWALTALLSFMVLVRYIDIKAPAIFGRSIDLYWDVPQIPDVAAMLAATQPAWQVAVMAAGALALCAAIVAVIRWCVGVLDAATARPGSRRALGTLAAVGVAAFVAGKASDRLPWEYRFAIPVSTVIGEQAAILAQALLPEDALAAHAADPLPESDMARLGGGDVYVVFLESYGAYADTGDGDDGGIAAGRAAWESALDATGRHAVTAYLDSPTYGGLSWLAHGTVLYGLTADNNADYHRLLKSGRDNLADRFRGAGYRTVALVPGVRKAWPEGKALHFDTLYDAASLDYPGPAFGWWTIPDQYALDTLWRREIAPRDRAPLFAFYPTITSHFPFTPLPPYQADWNRLAGDRPYDPPPPGADPGAADLPAAYRRAVAYDLQLMAGFVAERMLPGAVLIVLGDHQPPAVVGGRQESAAVPVHVIAGDESLLRPFRDAGFTPGLQPSFPAAGPMVSLTPLMLQAFDGRRPGS